MTSGAFSLSDYLGDVIVLACTKCDRRGRYGKGRMIAEHGRAIGLPNCSRALPPTARASGIRSATIPAARTISSWRRGSPRRGGEAGGADLCPRNDPPKTYPPVELVRGHVIYGFCASSVSNC